MHVGIHSGLFDFFLVGSSHRELVVAGPGATRTVEMEGLAAAGEILLSDEAAALVSARLLGEARAAGGRLLRGDPKAAPLEAPLPEVSPGDLVAVVPPLVREVATAGTVEAEHRHACIAFIHFGGNDAAIAQDPASAAIAVEAVVRSVQAAAERFGVCFLESDIDVDGGRIVLVAGAPEASENDEERMLRTLRAAFDERLPLPLRAGVNRGRVVAGEVGAPFRRTYTILGDTAALAARLMARARPDQILATAAVLERSRTTFTAKQQPGFVPKGKSAEVVPLAVGDMVGTQVAQLPRAPLVGRTRELALLSAALGPVRLGFGTLVELVGDAGIGKSRLLEELRAHTEGMTVLRGACEQYEAGTPYFASRELLRELIGVPLDGSPAAVGRALRGRLAEIAPELLPWLPLLAIPLDVNVASTREVDELQPAFRRTRLHGALETLLQRLLPGPSALLLEDVHWMDEASSELLRHLAGHLASHPWFVCATRRPGPGGFSAAEGTPPVPAVTMRLEPLAPEEAKALVRAADVGVDDEEAEAIAGRAGGNPLFLQELVAARAHADDAEEDELPETVEAVVASRIDRLSGADRALLRWASVLGQAFPGELVAAVVEDEAAAGDSDAWNRLAEFVERDPDVPGGFRFRHALIRDAAYAGLSFRRRAALHARAAVEFERLGGEQVEVLSLHYFYGERWADAWRTSIAAGERAQAKFANVDAAEFYARALEAARRLRDVPAGERARVWEARGDVCELAGLYAQAIEAYRNARRAAPSPRLLLKEGNIRERAGDYAGALRWYRRGLKAAGDAGERELVVDLRVGYAGTRYRQGHFADAIRWARDAVDLGHELDYLPGLAHGYFLLHLAHTSIGHPDRAAFRGLALPIYEELGDLLGQAHVLNNLGIEAYYDGRWDEALELYGRSKAARSRIGDVVNVALVANNIGEIHSDQGRLDEARALFEESRDVAARAGGQLTAAVATLNLGRLAAREGRFDEAQTLVAEALVALEALDAHNFVLEAQARLAEVTAAAGAAEEGLRLAEEGLVDASDVDTPLLVGAILHRARGLALRAGGDEAEALRSFEASLEAARAVGADYELALALTALGRDEEAAPLLARLGVDRLGPV